MLYVAPAATERHPSKWGSSRSSRIAVGVVGMTYRERGTGGLAPLSRGHHATAQFAEHRRTSRLSDRRHLR